MTTTSNQIWGQICTHIGEAPRLIPETEGMRRHVDRFDLLLSRLGNRASNPDTANEERDLPLASAMPQYRYPANSGGPAPIRRLWNDRWAVQTILKHDDYRGDGKPPFELVGYDGAGERWFRVELPEIIHDLERCRATAWRRASGKANPPSLEEIEACFIGDHMVAFCRECGNRQEGLEPDVERAVCDACGLPAVDGAMVWLAGEELQSDSEA